MPLVIVLLVVLLVAFLIMLLLDAYRAASAGKRFDGRSKQPINVRS